MMLLLATTALVLLAGPGGGDKSAETVTVSETAAADRDYPVPVVRGVDRLVHDGGRLSGRR